jgi:DNA-binding NtrC family response regulator
MQLYLDRMGYTVYAAATSAEVHEMLANESQHINLAIVDLSLLRKPDALVEIADRYPQLRILVCSGQPFEVGVLPDRLHSRFSSLQKPFLPDMLSRAVQELLARSPAV